MYFIQTSSGIIVKSQMYAPLLFLLSILAACTHVSPRHVMRMEECPSVEPVHIIEIEKERFNSLVMEFKQKIGRYIQPRSVSPDDRIQLLSKSVECAIMTWAEAYLVGITNEPPPPGREGQKVIACVVVRGSAWSE
jgi:hypothetical protein